MHAVYQRIARVASPVPRYILYRLDILYELNAEHVTYYMFGWFRLSAIAERLSGLTASRKRLSLHCEQLTARILPQRNFARRINTF